MQYVAQRERPRRLAPAGLGRSLRAFSFGLLFVTALLCGSVVGGPVRASVADGVGATRPVGQFVVMVVAERAAADTIAPAVPGAGHHGTVDQLFDRQDPLGSFAAGFLGAGLIGLLFGHGFFSGLNGPGTIFGVVFQFVLILIFVRLLRVRWRADRAGAGSPLSPRELADAYGRVRPDGQSGA